MWEGGRVMRVWYVGRWEGDVGRWEGDESVVCREVGE